MHAADTAIAHLQAHKSAWANLPIPARLDLLHRCIAGTVAVAEDWAIAACRAKGIDPNAPLAGEEWLLGPVGLLLNLRLLIQALAAGGQPRPVSVRSRADGQQVAQVFPDSLQDRLMWLGFRGEVWIEPGQPASQGQIYRPGGNSTAGVALVLGAGNVSAIAPMDALSKLFAENQVVLLKLNPVSNYVKPFLETALRPLIEGGFLAIITGDAAVGAFLCQHEGIDTIHVTGSHHTHDAILWGNTPAEQAERKAANQPVLAKPITSELGCVTPILVVPGRWSVADLQYQAQHVASMVAHNASFNCVAGKALVLSKHWPQRDDFLAALKSALAATPARKAYYPGAQDRYQAFLDRYPQAIALAPRTPDIVPWTLIPDVPPAPGEYALTTEAFCGVLAEVSLDAGNTAAFLQQAVDFANETLWGTLSCVLLIDPATQRQNAAAVERAIAQLRYGNIGINAWTGMNFLLSALTWGAFPGNPLSAIGSGRGIVHNAYLFDYPQKSVVYAPFHIRPKPIWFANHRTLQQVTRRYVEFLASPNWRRFAQVAIAALRG
ncbi:aldehyde dehydrogenase family protein [Thermoleptolyngbya sichuanensis A183]|uniref:Aldehyde dehydrogenase family protein n=1 Tax=Thermoleptolyngbya sichuanensis A183 TaxID=2737172 RepID=A0A6M8B4F8_9CYAN|nr:MULTISPECIES: aldehyde dehydrogenase family protein [Thermoleptolyngbya]QKD82109.1 aldehyde dehydrogenase family protein [Thermoleptolyngbya sichuanensis A183]